MAGVTYPWPSHRCRATWRSGVLGPLAVGVDPEAPGGPGRDQASEKETLSVTGPVAPRGWAPGHVPPVAVRALVSAVPVPV